MHQQEIGKPVQSFHLGEWLVHLQPNSVSRTLTAVQPVFERVWSGLVVRQGKYMVSTLPFRFKALFSVLYLQFMLDDVKDLLLAICTSVHPNMSTQG